LPDLSGSWTRLLVSYQGRALLGYIRVSNTGNRNASNFYVSCYISNDGQGLDTFLKRIPVYWLPAGKSTDLGLAQVSRTSLSGKYIIAVIDSGNQVAESNETNNRAVRLIP
jgi:subtilase family serine protease